MMAFVLLFLYKNLERLWARRKAIFFILYVISFEFVAITHIGRIDLNDMVVYLFLLIWLIDQFMNPEETLVKSPVNPLILIFLFFLILSGVNGGMPAVARSLTTVSKYLLVFFLLINLLQTRDRIHFLMKIFLIITSLSAIIALSQSLIYALTGLIFAGTVDDITLSLMFQETPFGTLLRSPAFFGYPQKLASVLSVTLAVSLYYLVSPILRGLKERVFLLIAIFIMSIALVMTFSRGAWLGFAVAAVLIPYTRKVSRAIHYTAALLLVAIIFYYAGTWGFLQMKLQREMILGDVGYRIELLKSALEGFMSRHPYIGIGIDQGPKYHPNPFQWAVHNAFALAAVEIGIFGFLVYCSFFVLLFARLIYLITSLRDEKEKTLPKALLVGFIAHVIYLQADPAFHDTQNWIYFALVEGTFLTYRREHNKLVNSGKEGRR
jgi:O-antigen ligase